MVRRPRLVRVKPKPGIAPPEPLTESFDPETETGAANPEQAVLNTIIAASSSDDAEPVWSISVWQPKKKGEAHDGWCFDCLPGDLPNIRARLLEEFGAGLYRVRVRKDDTLFRAWDMKLLESRKPTTARAVPASENSEVVRLLGAALEKQQATMDAIAAKLNAAPAPGPAPATDPVASFSAMLVAMKSFQELIPKPAEDIGLKMFERGMELAQKVAGLGGEKSETGILDIVREAIASPVAQEIARAFVGNIGNPPAPVAPMPPSRPMHVPGLARVAAPRAPDMPAPTNAPAASNGMPQQLTEGINYLIGQAQAGAQPSLFTDYVLANVPDHFLDQLSEAPDPFAMLAAAFPQVAPYRAWFGNLIESLYESDEGNAGPDHARRDDTALPKHPNT